MFAHDEVETILSDARIPAGRQLVYAPELIAGVTIQGYHFLPIPMPTSGSPEPTTMNGAQ